MQRQSFKINGSIEESIESALHLAQVYLPLFSTLTMVAIPSLLALVAFFESCQTLFVRGAAERKAFAASQSFPGIPVSVLDEATSSLQNNFGGCLRTMIASFQLTGTENRFNEQRCCDVFTGDPEFETLRNLATIGAEVAIEEGFVVQSSPEPLRKLHLRLGNCIPQHAFKLWEDGKALLFRIRDLGALILHYNNAHWTSKPGVDDGRFLFDCANIANGSSINSDYAFQKGEETYQPLCHPTILQIVAGILFLARALDCDVKDLRLWKDDIRGAFSQFNFSPDICFLLATQVALGVVMIYTAGCFGLAICPLIFGVFSRALQRVISSRIAGTLFIYVDDLIGVSHSSSAAEDQLKAQDVITATFGPRSLADKSVWPCLQAEILGWFVDLDLGTIRPNDRAIKKLMFAFFTVDLHARRWPLRQCQMLASLAERYSLALCGMSNFVQPLHAMCGAYGLNEKSSYKSIWRNVSSQARFAVEMWRMAAVCLYLDPILLAMPLTSLVAMNIETADTFFISDAGPLKLGFAIYNAKGGLLWYSAYAWPFIRNDNYQNAKEFLAFLIAVTDFIRSPLFKPGCCIHWTGDNSSALSWVDNNRCKSIYSQRAYMLFSIICVRFKITVVGVQHRPGMLMGAIDALSRDMEHDLDPSLYKVLNDNGYVSLLMSICDPVLMDQANLVDHHVALGLVMNILDLLV